MTRPAEGPKPWYHHFWPWFILVLMLVSVAASLWTVVIAFRHRDVEVGAAAGGASRAESVLVASRAPHPSGALFVGVV